MVAPTPPASKKRLSSGAQHDPSDTLHWEGSNMRQCYQRGCLRRTQRKSGPDCWEFLWRENDVTGKRVRRNKVIGTVTQFPTEDSARAEVNGLRIYINQDRSRQQEQRVQVADLVDHYIKTELSDNAD